MKFKNIVADLKIYSRNYMRSTTAIFFVFIFPLILMLLFGSIFSGSTSSSVPLYVQNLDTSGNMSNAFIETLNSTHFVDIHMIPDNVNIQTYISQHSITAALLIPANFTASYSQGQHVSLTYYNNPAVSTSSVAQQAISVTVQLFNSHFATNNQTVSVASASVTTHAANYIDFLIPGLIGLVILTSPMFSMTYIVSSYKKEKIFRQLSLTPLTKSEWFLSKFIWYLIISALSAVMIIGIGTLLFHSTLSISLYVIPFLVVGVFMFTSLGILAGSISKSEESASVIGNIITFPMMFLSGTFFPIQIMPAWLQSFAHVLPLFYIIDGLNSVTIYSNYSSAALDLAVSIAVAVVIFVLTVWKFSWKEQ